MALMISWTMQFLDYQFLDYQYVKHVSLLTGINIIIKFDSILSAYLSHRIIILLSLSMQLITTTTFGMSNVPDYE
jgi:hypothetical protein